MTPEGFYSVESLSGVHVLLVDPEPHSARLLGSILAYAGALVTTAGSAGEALRIMQIAKCDALVVAFGPPAATELIRQIRGLKPEMGGMVPAIGIGTRLAADDDGARFDAVLARPFDPWALCRLIANVVARGGRA